MDVPSSDRVGVRDITSAEDRLLEEYGTVHTKIVEMCAGTKGLFRSQSIAFFNDSYRLGRDVRDSKSIFTYTVSAEKQNSHPEMLYLHKVLELCANSDICSKLGLSISDFMEMELNTFLYIEDYWRKLMKKESDVTKNILSNNGIDMNKL